MEQQAMRKLEYLDALKRAMIGLPPETQAKTLAYYEQRFVDGAAAGRGEEDVARELGDPAKIAMTLRASTHLNAFEQKKNPANFARMLAAGVGLAIFNLFMLVPAAVYMALLAALYACSLALYAGGIVVTASGLSGTNELVLKGPLHHIVIDADDSAADKQARITIFDTGIRVHPAKAPAGAAGEGADTQPQPSGVLRGAEAVAGRSVQISSAVDAESRTTQTFFGLGMVVGGIVAFLLSLVVTRYTLIGIRRYIQMNMSLLRGS